MLKMSTLLLRTLRDDPADAEVASHRLLVRAGFVRRIAAGIYSWLPLGYRTFRKIEQVVREEMDAAGFQEVHFPALLPKEPYESTNRWSEYGPDLFRLQDRKGNDYLLGPTHEEMFTLMVKGEFSSYKDLPLSIYQIQTKYRDETRPRSGIIRGREFVMKDSYSFDLDDEGLEVSYNKHREAYIKTFDRLGLKYNIVSAMSGAMGGSKSEEFLAPCPTGEDTYVLCNSCGYAANVEAMVTKVAPFKGEKSPAIELLDTPNTPTIDSLVEVLNKKYSANITAANTLKNILLMADGAPISVLVPGDREVDLKRLGANLPGVKDLNLPQVPTNDINNLTVPLCVPVADFNADKKAVCVGTSVQFSDESWNAVVASRTWTFEGGTPATSTSANPVVSWADYGWKKVTLVVTNDAGSDTKTEQSYLYVSPDWADYTGPVNFNMESNNHLFLVQNIEDNYGKFAPKSGVGMDGSTAFKLQTYKNTTGADAYTNDWFYNGRLGLSTDNLITPSVDLRNTSSITVSFDYAYATNATQTADITEVLKVYSSRDCGQTWSTRATITGNELVTAGYASNSDFNPTSNTMYVNKSFSYPATSQDNTTRFKFEFVASDVSSNLFIDNININGTLGLNSTTISDLELVVYPNPTQGEAINVSYTASEEPTTFTLRDVQGKVIATQTIETTNASVTEKLNNTQNLPAACYFLEVTTGDYSTTKKVVVM